MSQPRRTVQLRGSHESIVRLRWPISWFASSQQCTANNEITANSEEFKNFLSDPQVGRSVTLTIKSTASKIAGKENQSSLPCYEKADITVEYKMTEVSSDGTVKLIASTKMHTMQGGPPFAKGLDGKPYNISEPAHLEGKITKNQDGVLVFSCSGQQGIPGWAYVALEGIEFSATLELPDEILEDMAKNRCKSKSKLSSNSLIQQRITEIEQQQSLSKPASYSEAEKSLGQKLTEAKANYEELSKQWFVRGRRIEARNELFALAKEVEYSKEETSSEDRALAKQVLYTPTSSYSSFSFEERSITSDSSLTKAVSTAASNVTSHVVDLATRGPSPEAQQGLDKHDQFDIQPDNWCAFRRL